MKLLLGLLVVIPLLVHADIADLEEYISQINHEAQPVVLPQVPSYQPPSIKYKPLDGKNIFDQRHNHLRNNSYLQEFNLNQLQMVGFMEYHEHNYAFVKTPYETIRVTIGDKVKNGIVVKITATSVQIDELQQQNNKSFIKKYYLTLKTSNEKSLGKLASE